MTSPSVFAIGTDAEISHHVAPFADDLRVQMIGPESVVERARPGDLAIFYSEHFDRFRHACVELKKRQVATLYMIDGILEWRNAFENRPDEPACPWTMRSVLSHKVACIGASQQRLLDLWGNQGKTELVGIPRLEDECRGFLASLSSPPLARQGSDCSFRLMIASAKTPGFTEQQVQTAYQSLIHLRDFLEQLRRLPDGRTVEVVWRIQGDLGSRLQIENQCTDTTGGELAEQLRGIDAVITTPSTLMLEGMLRRKPVAVLNFHYSPLLVPSPWTIHHREQFAAVIAELSSPPAAKLELQNWWLRDALYCETNAVQRMVELIDGMLRFSRDQISRGLPLGFPPMLLPAAVAPAGNCPLELLYPQFPEWGIDSTEQLAGELIQARREIAHLQHQLAQAKSELAAAHKIFEEIRRHPIAGPIVRIRESLLSMFRSRRQTAKEYPPVASAKETPGNLQDVLP